MSKCECGCGQETEGGKFAPGHDQKLRSRLEQAAGGLLAVRDLVEDADAYVAGETSEHEFLRRVRNLWARRGR